MAFQSTVTNIDQASGVVGEFAFIDGGERAFPYTLDSSDAANNVIGRVFTVKSEGVAQAGGTGEFAGILINPKAYAYEGLFNSTNGQLACRNGSVVEIAKRGYIWIRLEGAAAIGAALKYTNATGVIATGAPSAGETAIPNAKVSNFTVSGAGLACIELSN